MVLLHELQKLSFAQYRVAQIEPCKLNLLRMMNRQLI
jgi:hypothetical protein